MAGSDRGEAAVEGSCIEEGGPAGIFLGIEEGGRCGLDQGEVGGEGERGIEEEGCVSVCLEEGQREGAEEASGAAAGD